MFFVYLISEMSESLTTTPVMLITIIITRVGEHPNNPSSISKLSIQKKNILATLIHKEVYLKCPPIALLKGLTLTRAGGSFKRTSDFPFN